MFKNKLYHIMKDLDTMKSHSEAIERCVEERLNSSLDNYKLELENAYDYLKMRSELKVARNMNKMDFGDKGEQDD